jgi:hypothetical protein
MRSLPATLAVAAILVLGLAGCVPEGAPEPSGSPDVSSTHQPAVTPTEKPEPAVTDVPSDGFDSTPVRIDCNELVSPQAVYDYNPNYGHQPDSTPPAGTDVATIVANQGVACTWVNQTSGMTFVVAVAQLAAADISTVKASVESSSTSVSGLGDSAYFTTSGGVGVAQVFAGPYWLVASSSAFYEIAEPRPLLQAALAALGR